jgi:hypothetical protein
VVIEYVRDDGSVFRSAVKWANLIELESGLFQVEATLPLLPLLLPERCYFYFVARLPSR